MKKVFISGRIPVEAKEKLAQYFAVTAYEGEGLISEKELVEGIADAEGLLCLLSDTVSQETMAQAPHLKIIANYGAGFNNIDVMAATERKIPVTNTPLVSTNATADMTWALILGIARRVVDGDKLTRAGNFTGWAPLFHLGVEVTGKTLGIFGMGNIGKAVARRAKGFEMEILYHSRTRLTAEEEQELGARYVSFEELLTESDFLTLHSSYSPELHHLLSWEEFRKMKKSAFLINAARGPMVDEAALAEVLKAKEIAGAGLDVYEFEPKVTESLMALDNVILAPHLGNATVETRAAMAEIAANNIIEVLNGRQALNCVNPAVYG
jgi:Lactate dehydrogenase and related dehydrogenases